MFPLALGLCLDVYLIAAIILEQTALGAGIAVALFVIFMALWIALPMRERAREA